MRQSLFTRRHALSDLEYPTEATGWPHVLLVGASTFVALIHEALMGPAPHVDYVASESIGCALASRYRYDLIVVDQPTDAVGRALCRRLRAAHVQSPILILSTVVTFDTVICALDAGADDVLVRPAVAALRAHLLALLHTHSRAMVVVTERSNSAGLDDVLVLTPEEYALLQSLDRHAGTLPPPDRIAAEVWGEGVSPLPGAVHRVVATLSAKLAAHGTDPANTFGDMARAVELPHVSTPGSSGTDSW